MKIVIVDIMLVLFGILFELIATYTRRDGVVPFMIGIFIPEIAGYVTGSHIVYWMAFATALFIDAIKKIFKMKFK